MKEVCFINKGENINKFRYLYNNNLLKLSDDKLFNNNYLTVKDGSDEIIIVKNYLPYFIYNISKKDNVLDIMARGFNVDSSREICENDVVVLTKPHQLKHIVKPLENLDKIANIYSITKDEIIKLNGLQTDKVFVGQILWI